MEESYDSVGIAAHAIVGAVVLVSSQMAEEKRSPGVRKEQQPSQRDPTFLETQSIHLKCGCSVDRRALNMDI